MTREDRDVLALLPRGAQLEPLKSGHRAIRLPDGRLLRKPSGMPVTVACSPSDVRSIHNLRSTIRRALNAQ